MYSQNPTGLIHLERLIVAIQLCEKRMKDVDDQLDDPNLELTLNEREWEIIRDERMNEEALGQLRKEQWFVKLKGRLDQFDECEGHGEGTWGAAGGRSSNA